MSCRSWRSGRPRTQSYRGKSVEPEWISLSGAIKYVTSIVLSPYTAEQRLIEALDSGELPAQAQKTIIFARHDEVELDRQLTAIGHYDRLDWVPPFTWKDAMPNWADSS